MKTSKFIDLFAGCGGLSLGAMKAGFEGEIAIEHQENAFKTLEFNLINNGIPTLDNKKFNWPEKIDKKAYDINDFIEKNQDYLDEIKGTIDLIVGGPPCQGFSSMGKRKKTDPRNQLYKSYIKFIEKVKPKIILIENVAGIASKFNNQGKSYKDNIIDKLKKDYYIDGQIIWANDFGVPQIRKRFIIIGFLKENFPDKIILDNVFDKIKADSKEFTDKYGISKTTCYQALSDLDGDNNESETIDYKDENAFVKKYKTFKYKESEFPYQEIMRLGKTERDIADSHRIGEHLNKTKSIYSKLINIKKNKKVNESDRLTKKDFLDAGWSSKKMIIHVIKKHAASPTITTCPYDYIHYEYPRILTVREFARIQSFPDWFEFKGLYATSGSFSYTTPRYTQIGNAVPPLMAESILKTLKSYL
jgi:DNA (cytosine-5)-methyltransferase 1